jgi:hypothetical protein
MTIETPAVETKVEAAAPQPETVATPIATEAVDYEAVLAKKDAELAEVRLERENYRKGMLKAKGKLPEEEEMDTSTPEGMEALVDRKVQEKFLSTKEAQLQADKDAALKAMIKRNKELEVALKNRGQILSSTGTGSNTEKPEGKTDNYFSNEQIAALRAKGYDDKKIETLKKNMSKGTSMPK